MSLLYLKQGIRHYVPVMLMGFTEKMDVLDLMISFLKEHEKSLDELVRRLEIASMRATSTAT